MSLHDSIKTITHEDNSQKPSESSRRSSHSTTTTNTDDDQYELARQLPSTEFTNEINTISSPEMISSADEDVQQQVQTPTAANSDANQINY